ncbi:MAG: SPASM domain-containing protein [Oligoflexia bacterium]|nr:SPASM domain-containing protein [Oligoflexia bacterium]
MILPKFPLKIQIEICNFCNAGCTTCPVPSMKRKREIMNFNLFSKIILELKERDFDGEIYPFISGESLLVKNFVDYLRLIKNELPKAKTILYTNASKLDEELSKQIIQQKLLHELVVSFDGGTKESYEIIRKNLSFKSVKHNLHTFFKVRDDHSTHKEHILHKEKERTKVTIRMTMTKENAHTKNDLKREFQGCDEFIFQRMHNWGGQIDRSLNITKGLGKGLGIFSKKSNFCWAMHDKIYILTNGDVSICCLDYEAKELVGNVEKSSIAEVWAGSKFNHKRECLHKRIFSELPLCNDCDIIKQNIVVQQFVKLKPLIELKFPKAAKSAEKVYKLLFMS